MNRPIVEKRDMQRTFYVRGVSYKPIGGTTGKGEILDMGNGGARMRTVAPPDTGTVLQAWIPLTDFEIAVPVLGLVRWMKKERRHAFQVGIQYLI